jgi:CubicO group peptidase (beta-lactamase class C family)
MQDDVDVMAREQVDAAGPGAAVAVVLGGETVHRAGYGMASLEWGRPIAPDTVFGVGSLTKPFTATAILLLEREGRLRLDDEIDVYLPGYDTHGAAITLRHLLAHTSGVPNYVTQPGFFAERAPLQTPPPALRALFEPLPLDFAPGVAYRYSNSGYALLGTVIEAVSGMGYGDFVRERIFAPLGMEHSYYLRNEAIIPHRAEGYERAAGEREGGSYERAPYASATLAYAAGGLGSTLDDLITWDRALRERKLLDAATLERMWTPLRLNTGRTEGYGLGWGLSTYRGRRVVHHAGGVPGFSAFYGRFVEDDVSMLVLSNLGSFDAAGLARSITNRVLDLPEPRYVAVTVPREALERIAGTYRGLTERLEVQREGERLVASDRLTGELVPLDERTFALAGSPDVTLRFEDERDGRFHEARVVVPFYWFNATRVEE